MNLRSFFHQTHCHSILALDVDVSAVHLRRNRIHREDQTSIKSAIQGVLKRLKSPLIHYKYLICFVQGRQLGRDSEGSSPTKHVSTSLPFQMFLFSPFFSFSFFPYSSFLPFSCSPFLMSQAPPIFEGKWRPWLCSIGSILSPLYKKIPRSSLSSDKNVHCSMCVLQKSLESEWYNVEKKPLCNLGDLIIAKNLFWAKNP